MGIVSWSCPDILLQKFSAWGGDLFVETGTNLGETARRAAKLFKTVVTIEEIPWIYEKARDTFIADKLPNITALLGNSAQCLAQALREKLPAKRPVFWLDAHSNESCPVLAELAVVNEMTPESVVMVDDARYFIAPPPYIQGWPTEAQLRAALENGGRRTVIVQDDVFIAEPKA